MSPGKLIFDTASPDWPVSACPCRILDPDQTAVQTTEVRDGLDRAVSLDCSLDMSILPRRPRGYGAIPDAHCPDPSPEDLPVGAIAISDEVSGRRIPRKGLRDLAGDPVGRWIGGDSDVSQPTPVVAQDDKAEQQFEGCCGNHEEIDRGNAIGVVSQKGLPRL